LFGFARPPFSLTSDPAFYFRSRSHSRVFDTLSAGLARRERLMLVLGDLGVGKTTLCRTLMEMQERKSRAALVGNALLSPEDLLRLMLQDLGAIGKDGIAEGALAGVKRDALLRMFEEFLVRLQSTKTGAVLIVDEAHSLPAASKELVVEIAGLDANRDRSLQILLAGQPSITGTPLLPHGTEEKLAVRARLLPFERDECEKYIAHRLLIAGGTGVSFSGTAIELIYRLSGGVARLVNLLAERGLQETAAAGATCVQPSMIESAASALDLLHIKPRRFRWYGTR
jgi:general secretion pathway protein A